MSTPPIGIQLLRVFLPLGVLGIAFAIAMFMIQRAPEPEKRENQVLAPLVQVLEAQQSDYNVIIKAYGFIEPKLETNLVAEVSGRITYIAPHFSKGGFFQQDDVLVKIDKRDYQLAKKRAEANLAGAEARLSQEFALAEIAQQDFKDSDITPSSLALREPQIAEAEALLAAAQAELAQAELNLERTEIKAPYPGRVLSKEISLEGYVQKGMPLGFIYSIQSVEARLPVPNHKLSYLPLQLHQQAAQALKKGRKQQPQSQHLTKDIFVEISSHFAGKKQTWPGKIIRSESAIEDKARVLHLVAEVKDPYLSEPDSDLSKEKVLLKGSFVEAKIHGQKLQNVFVLPYKALDSSGKLMVVDHEHRFQLREIEILYEEAEKIIIGQGLKPGDKICLTQLETLTSGTKVRIQAPNNEDQKPSRGNKKP